MRNEATYIPREQETPLDPPKAAPEWETDKYGQRFRHIGNVIEYEPTIRVNGIEVPQSQLADFHKRMREQDEARRKAEAAARAAQPPARICPFNSGGFTSDCSREKCAIFDGEACGLSHLAAAAPADTKGRKCPFSPYPCNNTCALYKSGCILAALKERN